MTRHTQIIGIRLEPEGDGFDDAIQWHIVNVTGATYATACGLDGNDSMCDQHGTVEAARGQRVTCAQCKSLWDGFRALKLREADFDIDPRDYGR